MIFSYKEVLNLYTDGEIAYSVPMYFKHRFDVQLVDFSIVQHFTGWKHFDLIHYVRYGQQFQRLADRNYENSNNYKRSAETSGSAIRFASYYTVSTPQGEVRLEFTFTSSLHGAMTYMCLAPSLVKRLVKVEHYQRNSKNGWDRVSIEPAKLERCMDSDTVEELGYEIVHDSSPRGIENIGSKVVVGHVASNSSVNIASKGSVSSVIANPEMQADIESQKLLDSMMKNINNS